MHSLRFGRKLRLPSTIAIKHIRSERLWRSGAEASVEVFRGQPRPAVPSAMPVTEINANTLSGAIRPF